MTVTSLCNRSAVSPTKITLATWYSDLCDLTTISQFHFTYTTTRFRHDQTTIILNMFKAGHAHHDNHDHADFTTNFPEPYCYLHHRNLHFLHRS